MYDGNINNIISVESVFFFVTQCVISIANKRSLKLLVSVAFGYKKIT